jgi:hypothetical protein
VDDVLPVTQVPAARRTWRSVVIVEVVLAAVLRIAVLARPLSVIDRVFLPDDTYYTLAISRSLAAGRGPSAGGQTITSGFQPLIAFLMVPVQRLSSDLDVGIRADLALLVACDVAIVILLAMLARRVAGPVAGAVAGGIWAASPAAVRLALGGLETTLAMVLELGLLLAWARLADRPGMRRGALLGAVGGLAVLARIDALALVGLLAGYSLWRGSRRPLVAAAGAFAVIVGPWWLYCFVRFGNVIPGSGAAAHALQPGGPWSSLTTSVAGAALVNGPFAVWSQVEGHLGDHRTTAPYWIALACFTVLGVADLARSRSSHRPDSEGVVPLVGVSAVFAAVLVAFYGWFNVAYYVSRYLGPVVMIEALLVGCGVGWVANHLHTAWRSRRPGHGDGSGRGRVPPLAWAAATAAAVTLSMAVIARPLAVRETSSKAGARYESATGYRRQVLGALALIPPGAVIGAAQSGTLSYFAGHQRVVVNLDGVVDPAAAEARRAGRLGAYVVRRRVDWVVDWTLNVAQITQEAHRADPTRRFVVVAILRAPGRPDVSVARRV